MFRLLIVAVAAFIWMNYSVSAANFAAYCGGIPNKEFEFQKVTQNKVEELTHQIWTDEQLKAVSQRLKRFSNGSYHSLPPTNILALYTEIDRELMWRQFKKQTLGEESAGALTEEKLVSTVAQSLVVLSRLENFDRCL